MKNRVLFLVHLFAINFATGQLPTFQWAKSMGGASVDNGNSVAIDRFGNVYTTGSFQGTVDFDPGTGTSNLSAVGFNDIFVSKLDGAGNFVWAKSIGGSAPSEGVSICVDSAGNVYTTGNFVWIVDFDPGAGVYNLTAPGFEDGFILKLDPNGNFVWAKSVGAPGTISDGGKSIEINSNGDVITTGFFGGTADFDPGAGVFNLTTFGTGAFLLKLDAAGNFLWAKNLGESVSKGMYVDQLDNVFTVGIFQGTRDFDPGAGVFTLTASGTDAFILKLNASGDFVWANVLGGNNLTSGNSIAVDPSGNVYTTGYFQGTSDFDPGSGVFNLTSSGSYNAFISKLNVSGNFVWAKLINGGGMSEGKSIAIDGAGSVYTTGFFQGTADFDPGPGVLNLNAPSYNNVFILILDSTGNLVWVKNMGGASGGGHGNSIKLDATGNIYTAGYYNLSCDFDPGPGTFNLTSAGFRDIFVHKMALPSTVGLSEDMFSNKFRVYPNPTDGSLYIDQNYIAEIIVTDVCGEQILKQTSFPGINRLDIRDLKNGIYFIKMFSAEGAMAVHKIIKE